MSWNRVLVLLAVVLVVLGGLAFAGFTPVLASIAGDVLEPEEPEADEQLVMEPHPGPNGEYASINEDGEIEIVADAVNPTSQSNVSDVFIIWNNATSTAEVRISHDNEDVVVFDSTATDEFGDIQSDEGITLDPDETVSVGFHIDPVKTAAGETLLEHVTFHAMWTSDEGSSGSTTETTTVDSFGALDTSDDQSRTDDDPSDDQFQTDDDNSGDEPETDEGGSDEQRSSQEDGSTTDDRGTSDDDVRPIAEFAGLGGRTILLLLGVLGGAVGVAHLVGRSS